MGVMFVPPLMESGRLCLRTDELLPAIDVVGCTSQRAIDHDV
jgi:hypothetical protein